MGQEEGDAAGTANAADEMPLQRASDAVFPGLGQYGVIGDLRTVALVGPGGRVDFLCLPKFDSPSVFAAHVDRENGGFFQLVPQLEEPNEFRQYFPDTNILLSRFMTDDGIAEVSDFMYLSTHSKRQALVRRAKAVHGTVTFRMRCAPRFDYARMKHAARRMDGGVVFEPEGDGPRLRLRSSVDLSLDGRDAVAEFRLEKEQTATFVLEESEDDAHYIPLDFTSAAYKETANYWRAWLSQCTYNGHWRNAVRRSALALKLLFSRDDGAIIAAPTFGFPADLGGERNWDYRYVWLRDASFVVYAFLRIGFLDEASAFMKWLERRIEEIDDGSELKTMYRLDGSQVEGEFHLDHLTGYKRSRPVRIGSTNHGQLQLDIYGEILDAAYFYVEQGGALSYDFWKGARQLVDFVIENWRRPDSSIWEVRGGEKEFLFSRVMCWVALDRALRLARKRSLPAPTAKWEAERDEIYHSVFEDFWDEEQQAFVQFKGSKTLDAAALIMPLVRFISPTDPRWISTRRVIQQVLAEDSLVYRYRVNQAFPERLEGRDATFSICSFWLIECLSREGDVQKARYLFEKMLTYGGPLGLYSEQISTRGEPMGNLPQAFTHLSLISAAFDLDRRLRMADPEIAGADSG